MSVVDANTLNVDARHVQNLTIHITYHTGPMLNPTPPPPMIEISQTSPPSSDSGGPTVTDSVGLVSEEAVAAGIEVSQKPPPSPESKGGPMNDSADPATEEELVAKIEVSQQPPLNQDSGRESVEVACREEVVAG